MAKPKTPAYLGVDLTPPAPVTSGGLTAASLQDQQNAANAANALRYGQGLGVLTSGNQATIDSIEKAITDSAKIGGVARQRIGQQLSNDLGQNEQDAISRGLGNTTIRNSMQDQSKRRANDAYAQLNEQLANQRAGLRTQEANAFGTGANSIAGYIANRNDVAPDASMYAQLQAQAAAAPKETQRTSTVLSPEAQAAFSGGSVNHPAGGGGGTSGGGFSGGGGAAGSITSAITGGGGVSSPQGGGSLISGSGGGAIAPSAPDLSGGYAFLGNGGYVAPGGVTLGDAGGYGGSVSNYLPQNQAGSISITPTAKPVAQRRSILPGCTGSGALC